MANRFEHVLPELVLQEQHVADALRCVLHTVLFVRAAGAVKPRDAHCPSLGLDYACAGTDPGWSADPGSSSSSNSSSNSSSSTGGGWSAASGGGVTDEGLASVDQQVDAAIRELRRRMVPAGGDSWRGAVAVQFYEARVTQRAFGLFKVRPQTRSVC